MNHEQPTHVQAPSRSGRRGVAGGVVSGSRTPKRRGTPSVLAWLRRHGACKPALAWVRAQPNRDPAALWYACPNVFWLLWVAVVRAGGSSELYAAYLRASNAADVEARRRGSYCCDTTKPYVTHESVNRAFRNAYPLPEEFWT